MSNCANSNCIHYDITVFIGLGLRARFRVGLRIRSNTIKVVFPLMANLDITRYYGYIHHITGNVCKEFCVLGENVPKK